MKKRFIKRRWAFWGCLLFYFLFFWNKPLFAEEIHTKVYWSTFGEEGLTAETKGRFVLAVNRGAKKEKVSLVHGWKSKAPKCKTLACRRKRSIAAKATWFMDVELEALGETYITEISFVSVVRKGVAWKKKVTCEICTLEEACKELQKTLQGFFSKARLLTRQSNVPEKKDPKKRLSPKETIKSDKGHASHKKKGQKDLSKPRVVKSRRSKKSKASLLRGLGWIFAGASLLGFVPGAVLLAIDGKGTCSGGGECPDLYDTKTGGIIALAAGGLSLAAAVTMYVLGVVGDKKERSTVQSQQPPKPWIFVISPEKKGATLGVVGRF